MNIYDILLMQADYLCCSLEYVRYAGVERLPYLLAISLVFILYRSCKATQPPTIIIVLVVDVRIHSEDA